MTSVFIWISIFLLGCTSDLAGRTVRKYNQNRKEHESYTQSLKMINNSFRWYKSDPQILFLMYYLQGVIYVKEGNNNKAIEAFKKSLQLEDSFLDTYLQLGYLYQKTAQKKLSLVMFNKCLQLVEYDLKWMKKQSIPAGHILNYGLVNYSITNRAIENSYMSLNKNIDGKFKYKEANKHLLALKKQLLTKIKKHKDLKNNNYIKLTKFTI